MNHSTDLGGLLLVLGRAGVELAAHPSDPARLRHRPPTVPPDLADGLRLHRGAIVGLLAGVGMPEPGTDAAGVLAERLGMADGLGVATAPGSPRWMIAVGKALGGVAEPLARDPPTDAEPVAVPSAAKRLERRAAELAEAHYRDRGAKRHWGLYYGWQMGPSEQSQWRKRAVVACAPSVVYILEG